MSIHKFDLLAVRGLNHARVAYLPTYLGLRLVLRGIANSTNKEAHLGWLERKLESQSEWAYKTFLYLKGFDDHNLPNYRQHVAASPITTLVESYILQLLSNQSEFASAQSLYSNRWPKRISGRNFQYFYVGYSSRTSAITRRLLEDNNQVAVILDIKKYYPSTSKQLALDAFKSKLKRCNFDKPILVDRIGKFAEEALAASPGGIPVGPDIGHLLGSIVLEELDRILEEKFPGSYFRYVDDIVVVCNREMAQEAIDSITRHLADLGLAINESKTDVISGQDWAKGSSQLHPNTNIPQFHELLQDIAWYWARSPSARKRLRDKFVDKGYSLPFKRIESLSEYSRFRGFFDSRGKFISRVFSIFRTKESIESELLNNANLVRQSVLKELAGLSGQTPETRGMKGRWFGQKCRNALNKLVYLTNESEYNVLLQLAPKISDTNETRVLIEAMLSGNVIPVLSYPGRVANAFAELWTEKNTPLPHIQWPNNVGLPEFESIYVLALHGLVDKAKAPNQFPSEIEARMLSICLSESNKKRINPDHSFMDELESLQLGGSPAQTMELVTSRYSPEEDFALGVLRLGEKRYS